MFGAISVLVKDRPKYNSLKERPNKNSITVNTLVDVPNLPKGLFFVYDSKTNKTNIGPFTNKKALKDALGISSRKDDLYVNLNKMRPVRFNNNLYYLVHNAKSVPLKRSVVITNVISKQTVLFNNLAVAHKALGVNHKTLRLRITSKKCSLL